MTSDPGSARRSAVERLFQHGGDVHAAALAFPEAPTPWLDLSTGVNPAPYPIGELAPETWTRLPNSADLEALQSTAGECYGVPGDRVVAAPGTQALIQWLPRLFPAQRVVILGPTYGEHERSWRAAGAAVEIVAHVERLADADVAVVVNPNNPDGRLVSRRRLLALAESLARRSGLLIVDEAFIDREEDSLASSRADGAIVLRSFGKCYGLAGLRIGFALAAPAWAERVRAALGPWAVSGPAIAIGRRALSDHAWLQATRDRLREDAAWLDVALAGAGMELAGGTLLFRLARHDRAERIFHRLCERGILTRPFRSDATWLRFGIPTREQRQRLQEAFATM